VKTTRLLQKKEQERQKEAAEHGQVAIIKKAALGNFEDFIFVGGRDARASDDR
jgi:hypothetical protein